MTKPLYKQEIKNSQVTTQKHRLQFEYTTIADRVKTARLRNYSYPTGVVYRLTGVQPSHYPYMLWNLKDTYLNICK